MAIRPRLRFEVLQRDGFACRYCGARAPTVKLHVDHIVPKAAGGSDHVDNLMAACRECNAGKAARALVGVAREHPESEPTPMEDLTISLIRLVDILWPIWGDPAEWDDSWLEQVKIRLVEAEQSVLDHGSVPEDADWPSSVNWSAKIAGWRSLIAEARAARERDPNG